MGNFTLELVKVGTLPVNTTKVIYIIPITEAQRLYKIKIFTRKGIVEQLIKQNEKGDKWEFLKVKMHENDGTITELHGKIDRHYVDNKV